MKVLLLLLACVAGPDFESAVLFLSGASSLEDLDETTLERYRALELRPLELNLSSRSRLLASGLMSAFQVASLLDWKSRSGDILSYSELALIDGFGAGYAEALKPFTRLSSSSAPGHRPYDKLHNDIMVRGSVRKAGEKDLEYAAGLRYKASYGERAELNWATRTSYSDRKLGIGTVSGAVYGRKYLGKLILGHFNARFGQGLNMWSGFSLSPWSSVSALKRSGTGFSPTGSFSPACCGAAADFEWRRWTLSAAYSFPDKMPMGALSYTARRFTAELTASGSGLGADFLWGLRNVGVFGELCWKGRLDAVAGARWIPFYGTAAILWLRCADGLTEAAAGVSNRNLNSVLYWSTKQFRAMVKYNPTISAGPLEITPSLRLAGCRKDVWRLEGRGELQAGLDGWIVRSRLDIVKCKGLSWLFNAEAGRAEGRLKPWLRWTLFKVENWDDRIYVYERDAPGSFNVPAYYGKGWALSLAGGWKPSRKHSFYYRVSYIGYPWMPEGKDAKLEVKLQYQLSL